MTATFIPGARLCGLFFREAVRPVLAAAFPGLRYSAARIGEGSDVLGFDSARSTDHDWGPRVHLFLDPEVARTQGPAISAVLDRRLPERFRGWPVRYTRHEDGTDAAAADGAGEHRVAVTDPGSFLRARLGVDPRGGIATTDWLAVPAQRFAEVTGGAVYHDGLRDDSGEGALTALRARLACYPDDVRRYLAAALWVRLDQEEPFVGRAAEAGDDLGSRVVAARQARDVMRLCLLLARRYPPYSKWLGTAFAQVPEAAPAAERLGAALAAADPAERQDALAGAYEEVAAWQNGAVVLSGAPLASPRDPRTRPFHARPYPVLDARRFAEALMERVDDPFLRALPLVGGVDQIADSTDVLTRPGLARALASAAAEEGAVSSASR
ncbi:uncharacterized protein DUF4037 [Murinocardiopsis flavida]|uniref:Uncharacterized protein DUF4037 n=1 Tax=Murinocardiopsis flavida TaxID=645275 RepID=A0A2P8CZU4_9ACTN|nr:DUF4037 domain-containing protein [Murinocardiopsis flavida]PSK90508.1 uncharacterized protein DUF4037 [Murinocardiopsis flavida]